MIRVGGIVLCGGQSRRMSRPKAWLPFGEETMLTRIVRIVGEVVVPVVVVAASEQKVPPLPFPVEVVRDEEPDRGPLQGLAAGLESLKGRVDAAFLTSCDAPFLKPAVIRRLIDLMGEHQLCVPRARGFVQPLTAIYHVDVLPKVRKMLREDRLRPTDLLERTATRFVEEEELRDVDPQLDSLWNLNTPEEYQAALARLETSRQTQGARNSPTT